MTVRIGEDGLLRPTICVLPGASVHEQADSPHSVHQIVDDLLGERIEALAGWIQELDAQFRATTVAGDEKTLKELRRALEAWSKRDPKFEERLIDRVDVLADRLATLSSTVNTTAAAIAGNDGELAALRKQLDEGTARIEAAVRQPGEPPVAKGELEALRRTVASLSAGQPSSRGDRRVDDLSEKIENLSERLDTLAKTVATTAAGLAGREGELAALRRSLEDEHGFVEEVVAHLRDEAPADPRLEARVTELAAQLKVASGGITRTEREVAALRTGLGEERGAADAATVELRDAIATLAAHVETLERKAEEAEATDVDERLAALQANLQDLRAKLEAVAETVTSTSSSFAVQELELATLHRQLAEASARVDGSLAELRNTLGSLPDPATMQAALEERVEHVAGLVDAQASRIRAADARADAVVTELQESLEQLSSKVESLESRSDRTEVTDALQRQLESTARDVGSFTARVSALADTVETASSGVSRQQQDLAALRQQVAGASVRFDKILAELREDVDAAPDPTDALTVLDARLDEATKQAEARVDAAAVELRRSLEALSLQVSELQASDRDTALTDELESRLDSTAKNVAELGVGLRDVSAEVESAKAVADEHTTVLAELRNQVSDAGGHFERRLTALQEAVEAVPDLREVVSGLQARVEQAVGSFDTLSHRLAEADEASAERAALALAQAGEIESTLASVRVRLDALERSDDSADLRPQLVDVSTRVETLESMLEEVAARPAAVPPSEDEELERLLVAFADRIEAMEADRPRIAAEAAAAAGAELEELHVLLEGVGRRLEASEKQIAALVRPERDPLVEELVQRLERLERTVATPKATPGDGRFRVELRAIELRAEHAEAAARESREAVLVELERLATTVEERLQRLEAPPEAQPVEPRDAELGQVVPIRSSAET